MLLPRRGAIDCDVHPAVPSGAVLLPYLDDYWRDQIEMRAIHKANMDLTSYPRNAPKSGRADWRPASGPPGSDFDLFRAQALDGFGSAIAICNLLHGAVAVYNDDMGAALCAALNDWLAREWLDRDQRLRASITVSLQSVERAVDEIERVAADRRFVQVLMLNMGDMPLGRRHYWPIYRAAERLGLPIGIHAGSLYRHAPTPTGWPTHRLEDYVAQSQGFENQVLSFVTEGVFQEFPALRLVLLESGFTWLPTLLWRSSKLWRGLRNEVPWLDRPPAEIIRDHVRLTLQPVDAPPDPAQLARTLDHIGSDDMLMFSTDYPHWQFDGDDVLPEGLPSALLDKLLVDNALATYPRLREPAAAGAAEAREVPS